MAKNLRININTLFWWYKETTPLILKEKNKTQEILKLVKRMSGGPLAKKQLTKLKIYNGENHLMIFKT